MGVCIWKCDKCQENIIKDSSIDCYNKTDQSIFANVITSNNINDDKKISNMKYKKIFLNNSREKEKEKGNINTNLLNNNPKINHTFSNNATASNTTNNDKYLKSVLKIQNFYRKHTRIKNKKKYDDTISLKLNLEIMETVFSSNSLNNSNISNDNINNNNNNGYHILENNLDNKDIPSISLPFNIKTKLSNQRYKYSGYVKKKNKINSEDSPKIKIDNSNSCEEKEIIDNEEKKGLIKEGFGKFIFMDGSEFCGIFHNNTLQNYGKYSNINQKNMNANKINNNNNNNIIKDVEKEIIITDNINYEDFIGIYKNFTPGGFGIYTNLITNLKITGNFDNRGIYGIGIENSTEGGYIYTGEFKNNKKEGLGTIIWNDGCKYQGEFKNNQMNGTGTIYFSGNNYYQGDIKNGKMEGFGIFFWDDKRKYIGNYKNDKRNGFGIYMSKSINDEDINLSVVDFGVELYSSSTFVGFWKNGNMDGFGMKIYNNDIKYGIWENGFRKKYIESNLALKTYGKLMDKKYNKIFFETKNKLIDFLDYIFSFNINNNQKENKE